MSIFKTKGNNVIDGEPVGAIEQYHCPVPIEESAQLHRNFWTARTGILLIGVVAIPNDLSRTSLVQRDLGQRDAGHQQR
jgi:hypothetical protein